MMPRKRLALATHLRPQRASQNARKTSLSLEVITTELPTTPLAVVISPAVPREAVE